MRTPKLSEPQTRPLHSTFEDAGVPGTIRRLWTQLRAEGQLAPLISQSGAAHPPAWLTGAFSTATLACNPEVTPCAREHAMELVDTLRRTCQQINAERGNIGIANGNAHQLPPPAAAAFSEGIDSSSPSTTAALARICLGELLETYAALQAERICKTNEVPYSAQQQAEMARLCADAYGVAIWTSAHAEYLATASLMSTSKDDDAGIEPELSLVLCISNAPDQTALLERACHPRACGSADAQAMLALLMRATNAGSRGWESTLLSGVRHSEGIARTCGHAAAAAFTGMHPCLHPAARPSWSKRFVILRACRVQHSVVDVREMAGRCPGTLKEMVRLYLSALLAEDAATLEALSVAGLPMGQLATPPRSIPPTCLQAAMHAMVRTGLSFVSNAPKTCADICDRIDQYLTSEPRSRKKTVARPLPRTNLAAGSTAPLTYCQSWLGGRTSNPPLPPSLVCVVSNLLASSFRASYMPLCVHAAEHGHRIPRLDRAKYNVLHCQNAGHQLVANLDSEASLKAQRAAIVTPHSTLVSVEDACKLLGIQPSPPPHAADAGGPSDGLTGVPVSPPTASSSSVSRALQDAEGLLCSLSAHEAAMLVVFAKAAALRGQVLSYNLGAATREAQATAVAKRLLATQALNEFVAQGLGSAADYVMTQLPDNCCYVFCCTECRRVANAIQNGSGKDLTFNEIGLSASMLRVHGACGSGHMRCAKRSSAALRTAVGLEEVAQELAVETLARRTADADNDLMPRDLRAATVATTFRFDASGASNEDEASTDVAKLRRDVKNCLEQSPRALACGDAPLAKIAVLGRAIRLFGDWVSVCAFCGTLAKLHPESCFRSNPCCLKCDFAMLHGKDAERALLAQIPKPPAPRCRFCGRDEVQGATKFKQMPAPADTGGKNAMVPPPLRTVAYCSTHYRNWLPQAHTVMTTKTIFAHIALKARPVISEEYAAEHIKVKDKATKVRKQSASSKRNARFKQHFKTSKVKSSRAPATSSW